jgi:hypothetical protein
MEGLMSRSGKQLTTFEFERQTIAGCCKQTFCFQFNIKLIQSKNKIFSVFLVALLNGGKNQISLNYQIVTPIPSSFIISLELYLKQTRSISLLYQFFNDFLLFFREVQTPLKTGENF